MAIVNILHYQSSLYDHQGLRNMNIDTLKTHEWAWPIFDGSNVEFGQKIFHSYLEQLIGQISAELKMVSPMTKLR